MGVGRVGADDWQLGERSQRNRVSTMRGSIHGMKLKLDVTQKESSGKSQPMRLSRGEIPGNWILKQQRTLRSYRDFPSSPTRPAPDKQMVQRYCAGDRASRLFSGGNKESRASKMSTSAGSEMWHIQEVIRREPITYHLVIEESQQTYRHLYVR